MRTTSFAPGANQHKPAKQTRDRVPPGQQARILQKHVAGKSITEISKEEHRNRETVSKIVRGPEMQEFVREMRERLFGLASDAISAVQDALTEQKDGRLAFQFLVSIGVVPSPEERQSLVLAARQAAAGDGEDDRRKSTLAQLFEVIFARERDFGFRNPIEVDLEKVGVRINHETGKFEPLEKKTPT